MSPTGTPIENTSDLALIKAEGFEFQMMGFGTDEELDAYLQAKVDQAENVVRAEVGDTVYGSDDAKVAAAVTDARLSWVISECWARRKTLVLSSASYSGEEKNRAGISEEKSRDAALAKYESATARALRLSGVDSGFASSAEVSSHFAGAS